MELIRWRKSQDLTLAAAAARIGISGNNPARTYQRLETGEVRADADMVERIVAATGRAVTVQDMHDARLAWLRQRAGGAE